ncbi:MAG: DUF3179 domain-containing (seleno)protein [Candidatus Kariarchaeaceae archaeon]
MDKNTNLLIKRFVFFLILFLVISINKVNYLENPTYSRNQIFDHQSSRLHLNQYQDPGADLIQCSERGHPLYQREAIRSVDNPIFTSIQEVDEWVDEDDLIIGFEANDKIRGYPHKILREHEIVNDHLVKSSITYCPLTGSGIVYHQNQLNGSQIGVTGLLYESNLVFYDRTSDSCFSQMLSFGVSGPRIGQQLEYTPVIETTWKTWKQLYPNSDVLSIETGFPETRYNRNYYEFYETSSSIFYPSTFHTSKEPYNLFHPKMKTLVLNDEGTTYLFPFDELAKYPVSTHNVGSKRVLIISDQNHDIVYPYLLKGDNTIEEFEINEQSSSALDTFGMMTIKDLSNTVWNIKGEAIDGINNGKQLVLFQNFNAYWFAASTFFPDAKIFANNTFIQYNQSFTGDNVFSTGDTLNQSLLIFAGIVMFPLIIVIIVRRVIRKST